MRKRDNFTRSWIIENALEEIPNYEKGILTIRGLHYRLVARGMTNSDNHYKRVVKAMGVARWDGTIAFDTFSDNDRETIGKTKYETTSVAKEVDSTTFAIRHWINNYNKNFWENQDNYVEVFIEKKALQGLFSSVCDRFNVALNPCKGYPSITFLYEAARRFQRANRAGKNCIILYFGDYDPSGEDIPRSLGVNISKLIGSHVVEVRRVALMENQVLKWGLPPAPAKVTDSRTSKWDGLGQVELDAVEPRTLQKLCADAIETTIDDEKRKELKETEAEEKKEYKEAIRIEFNKIIEEDEDED